MSRQQRIKKLKKELDSTVNRINDLGDEVKKRHSDLQREHHVVTHGRISKVRMTTDRMEMDKDLGVRPSDKQLSIRSYSKMDQDIWKYDDVRKWFNHNAPTDNAALHEAPSATGYTVAR